MERLIVFLGVFACLPGLSRAEALLHVEIARADRTATSLHLAVSGFVQAQDSVPVGAKADGRLLAVNVQVGDKVRAGQVLAKLDPIQATEGVRAAEARLVAAEASLRQAEQAHARAASLRERGVGTVAAVDTAIQALLAAQSQRDQSNADLSKARQALADMTVIADGPGIVTQRHAEPGQVVSAAQSIVSLARDGAREAVFYAPDGVDLTMLMDRRIKMHTLDGQILKFDAKVSEISPVADPSSGTVKVTARLLDEKLQPGLGAAVSSDIEIELPSTYSMPWTVLATLDGAPAVWVVDPETRRVSLKAVQVSRYTDDAVEIASGIDEGDLVVGAGSNFLYPDRQVSWTGDQP